MFRKNILVVVVLGLLSATAAFAGPNYQEGLWEITSIMDVPGMPKEMIKPFKYTYCMTGENAVPHPQEKGEQRCKITDQRIKGNNVQWTMTCKDGTVTTGEITHAKNSFKGFQTTTTKQGGQKMIIKAVTSGKYLGPCKK
ncbi:MAG: DUF3617 family protein [Deltaproteobacteria bacterium]|nr:DUF3617 family protein [Deltaproteobacteria bacterium]